MHLLIILTRIYHDIFENTITLEQENNINENVLDSQ